MLALRIFTSSTKGQILAYSVSVIVLQSSNWLTLQSPCDAAHALNALRTTSASRHIELELAKSTVARTCYALKRLMRAILGTPEKHSLEMYIHCRLLRQRSRSDLTGSQAEQ